MAPIDTVRRLYRNSSLQIQPQIASIGKFIQTSSRKDWLHLTAMAGGAVVLLFAAIQLFSSIPEDMPGQVTPNTIATISTPAEESASSLQTTVHTLTLPAINLVSTPTEQNSPTPEHGRWLEEKVERGESLSIIFSRLELSATLLHNIIHSSDEAATLAQIKAGETLRVQLDDEGQLLQLLYRRSPINSLKITPSTDGFKTEILTKRLERRISHLSATITNSLYGSATRAGLSDSLIMELANIFGWDIDFALEIRKGDQFSLIFEEEYLAGEHYRNGPILAAEFINRGQVFRAIRYVDGSDQADYFSPEGKSMRKAFLRAPVDFRRISSSFARERYHPVLGKKRPHRGVDYAAATGTPIKAAGNGRVVFRGRKGGYGRVVIIKHGQRYSTLYAHMSKYRSKINTGSRVRQGDTIGYVGMSGLATGPHLHYEFRVNGVHRNPVTVKLPEATPITKKYLADFRQQSRPLLAQLDVFSKALLARLERKGQENPQD